MNDMNAPLGQETKTPVKSRTTFWLGLITLGCCALAYLIWSQRPVQPQETVVALKDAKSEQPAPVPPKEPAPAQTQKPTVTAPAPANTQSSQPVFRPRTSEAPKRPAWVFLPELAEETDSGILPKVAPGGLRPLDAYSNSPATIGATRVAIVIGGLGLSQTGTKRAIDALPSEVTLAFSATGNSLNRWMQVARRQGHELALQIPMEPIGYPSVDPGRNTLTSDATSAENLARLRNALGRMTNYPVVMNYLGGNFANKREALEPVLQEIKERGLAFLDDGTSSASIALDLAEELQVPNAYGNVVLDEVREPKQIDDRLRSVELFAQRRGFAIATGSAFPETVKQVQAYIKDAQKRGVQIVPLSNLVRDYAR